MSGEMVDLRGLREAVLKLPPSSPLRIAVLAEAETMTREEFRYKAEVFLKLPFF